jgi:hypothetical protein
MPGRGIHVEPLPGGLFAGHNHIDVIAAFEAVIRDRKQAVGIRGQVYSGDLGFLVGDMV